MTRKEFYKLDLFDEAQFQKGEKVLLLYGNEVIDPQEQKYYEGHPDPVVLKYKDEYHAFGRLYAQTVIRMAPKIRYRAIILATLWVVIDGNDEGKQVIASFPLSPKAEKLAKEYADFLNQKEKDTPKFESMEDVAWHVTTDLPGNGMTVFCRSEKLD